MIRGVNLYGRTDLRALADRNLDHVEDHGIVIEEGVGAKANVEAVNRSGMADERPPLLRLRQSARPRARGGPPPTSRAKRYGGGAISWSRPGRPEFLHRRGDTARRQASCLFRCGSCALQRAASRSGLFGCEGGSKTCRAPPP